jgi:N-sulfoglucosamine sulfohydrolase
MRIPRVILIALLLAGSLQPLAAAADGAAATAPSRPNIVLFIADDLTWHDIGAYGGDDVRTPNLDRLSRESLKFQYAFAASPTCTPSRSAIYTGIYPMRNGAHANHSLINDGITTLPIYLKQLGYRVVLAGKSHIGPREAFPFEYLADSNVMPPGKHELLWTDLNTAAVDALLKTHDRAQPLCLIVAAHSPHVYWLPNDGYEPASVRIPPYLLDTAETRAARCDYYTDVTHMDQQVGEVRASLAKHGYSDNTLFVFTADQGAQWPFSKWSLYDAGIRTPLLVRWPGKTRDGSSTDAMVSLIDLLPTFLEAAGGTAPHDIDGQSFLGVITGSTDHHRDEVFAAHTGDKEMNHAPMRAIRTTRFKYIVNLRPDVRYTTHISDAGPRDGRTYWDSWLRVARADPLAAMVIKRYYEKPPEELYDLSKDPYELNNVAADPAYGKTLAELRDRVKQWRLQQGEDLTNAPMPEDARTGEIRYAG